MTLSPAMLVLIGALARADVADYMKLHAAAVQKLGLDPIHDSAEIADWIRAREAERDEAKRSPGSR